ncbi:MAG: hypothetical protein H0U98_01590 [Alphaproteobacteria bacterium]|nr:hypothetical protein [Alphaproteobacteria bacterium]
MVNPGATLNDDAIIGDTSFGTFTNNSNHNVTGNLVLGNQSGGNGTYFLGGNSTITNIDFKPGGNGTNGTMVDPNNPDGPQIPRPNFNGALIVGNGGIGSFNQGTSDSDSGNQVNVAGDLAIGHLASGQGSYVLNSGTLTVGGQLSVGGQSTADNIFHQVSGSVILTGSAAALGEDHQPLHPDYVGVADGVFSGKLAIGGGIDNGGNDGGSGTYYLDGGTIDTTANGIEIGASGTGVMNQSGGSVNTTYLTEGFAGNGTYNLSGGTINAYSSAVGYAGTGAFNQSGGAYTIGLNEDGSLRDTTGGAALTIGAHCCDNALGSGIYTMTGGELHTGNMVVGDGEQGTFIQTTPAAALDPLVEVTGNLIVGGAQNGSVGSYSITGNDSFLNVKFAPGGNGNDGTNGTYDDGTPAHNQISRPNPNGALIIAQGLADGSATVSGTFTQDVDSHVNVAGDVVVGQHRNATGSYTLDSGDLTIGGKLLVGNSGVGTFDQSGGAVNVTGTAYGNPDYSAIGNASINGQYDGAGIAFIGGSWGSDSGTGTYTMSGGTLDAGGIEVGFTATGEMDQSGGVVTTQFLAMGGCGGCAGRNSVGIYRLSGNGELNVTFSGEQVGQFGHGEFYQTGGTNNVTGGLNIGDAPSLYTDHNGFRYGEPG